MMLPTLDQGLAAVKRVAIFATIIFALSAGTLSLGLCSRFGPSLVRPVVQPIAMTMGLQADDKSLMVLSLIASMSAVLAIASLVIARIFTRR